MIRPTSSANEIELVTKSGTKMQGGEDSPWMFGSLWMLELRLSCRMKASTLDCGMKDMDAGSKYTASGPSIALMSFLEKSSISSLEIFLFEEVDGVVGGDRD